MTKSLPAGGCQQEAYLEGDADNIQQHQASSSLQMSAVNSGQLLPFERSTKSETHMDGIGLEAFPVPRFPCSSFTALLTQVNSLSSFPALPVSSGCH